MKALIGTLASVALAGAASAQVSSFSVDTRSGDAGGTSVVANVLNIDFAGQYTGSQILVQLDSGSIYNNTAGSDVAPNPVFLPLVPGLEFDTFVAQGGLDSSADIGGYALGGGAVNIDPTETAGVFDSATKISQAYNPSAGNDVSDRTGMAVAQLTFSPDANGSFTYFASAGGEFFNTGAGTAATYLIADGAIVPVPEPATAALLGLGGLAMLRRRTA